MGNKWLFMHKQGHGLQDATLFGLEFRFEIALSEQSSRVTDIFISNTINGNTSCCRLQAILGSE